MSILARNIYISMVRLLKVRIKIIILKTMKKISFSKKVSETTLRISNLSQ